MYGDRQELIPRATITGIVGHRDRALAMAETVAKNIEATNELAKKLSPSLVSHHRVPTLFFGDTSRGRYPSDLNQYRKQLDAAAWNHVLDVTRLRDIMGVRQLQEWQKQLENDPPVFTVENVVSTFEQMHARQGSIFRQTIVDVFEALPRDFRSHDGFKIGSRCVLTSAVTEGYPSHMYWRHCTYFDRKTMLHDLDRAFHKLAGASWVDSSDPDAVDKHPRAVDIAAEAMSNGLLECETRFFRLRWFKNGNMHVWMKDQKVVEDANRELAAHYGAALGYMHLHPDKRPK